MEVRVVKRTIILSVLASLLGLVASAQASERLIGTDWVTAKMGYMSFPSDFDPIDTGWAFSGMGNWNVMDQLDVQGGLMYAWADDGGVELTITTINADALYFFQPNNSIKPYLKGGLAMVWTDVEVGGTSTDDSNLGYGAGGGAEFAMGDKAVMQLEGKYFVIDSDESFGMEARMAYAFTPKLLGDVSLNYNFDTEITIFSFGIVYRLNGNRRR